LLVEALTHRSYLNEHPDSGSGHNERLEFLGDAVLELITTEFFFRKYPEKNEGDLTAYRAATVNTETLYRVASEIGINDFLLLSRGEAKDTGRARQTILANAYEALIGALYLDRGFRAARDFAQRTLLQRMAGEVILNRLWRDAKSYFQEKAQEMKAITPVYKVLSERGPDHDKTFVVGLYLGSELVAEGEGSSKQRAEQEAARRGLLKYGWLIPPAH